MADPYLHFLVECEKKMRQIANERLEEIRAEVAEGIAQALLAAEPVQDETNPRYRMTYCLTHAQAAAVARGYTQPAETPGHRGGGGAVPVQPTQRKGRELNTTIEPPATTWLDSDADLMELFYGLACNARDAVKRDGGQHADEWDSAFERARDQYHAWLDRWVNRPGQDS